MLQIETIKDFEAYLQRSHWKDIAIQGLDLTPYTKAIQRIVFEDCIFLGCELTAEADYYLLHQDVALFPNLDVPFKVYLNHLYDKDSLYNGYDWKKPESYLKTNDYLIYEHFMNTGKGEPSSIQVTLARRLHDHAVTDALTGFLKNYEDTQVVAMMGGHSMYRDHPDYLQVALIAKELAEAGYLMITGGGPGAMEATHLGAWFAERDEEDLIKAIEILAEAPSYKDELWLSKAFQVMERFPMIAEIQSLGIPTWLYGHEPPTPFATHIAKYFANSVREEGLLAIAKGGVIFAPGSAGTIQEIFQDACQNHYVSFGMSSPMVFFNEDYWRNERPVYPLLEQMFKEGKYQNLILSISSEREAIVQAIKDFTS
jgi:predicted Rossmann-fold nucleotide-binding protein